MSRQHEVKDRSRRSAGDHARQQLLSGMPITERRLNLAGVPTAVLEGGDGPPVVLLHGQGHFAAEWVRVIPTLVASHHVVALTCSATVPRRCLTVRRPPTVRWRGSVS